MPPTRRELLGAVAASATLAGCLGGSTGGDGGGEESTTVRVRSHGEYGDMLVDADGLSLYRFDPDEPGTGTSACTGGCLDAWPPLSDPDPTAGGGVSAELSTFEREDGTVQVAADGWPLYYFASDSSPGDVEGQGVNDVWWLVAPDGSKITSSGSSGRSY